MISNFFLGQKPKKMKCIVSWCVEVGIYHDPKTPKERVCLAHKQSNMTCVVKQYKSKNECEKCGKRASWGFKIPTRCTKHQEKGMENLCRCPHKKTKRNCVECARNFQGITEICCEYCFIRKKIDHEKFVCDFCGK